jgi:hypothetical protein
MRGTAPNPMDAGKSAARNYRFPCGHVEAAKSVDARRRVTIRVAWVGCPRCNVVAIVVAPKKSARSSRSKVRRLL